LNFEPVALNFFQFQATFHDLFLRQAFIEIKNPREGDGFTQLVAQADSTGRVGRLNRLHKPIHPVA
jgi:hypothetical protein